MSDEQAVVEESTNDTLLDDAEPTLQEGEYFLSEGIKGTGEVPDWYIADRYKTVAEQAKGYSELEKKFGGFRGTPKNGYELPEGIEDDDVLLKEVLDFANDTNMSQDAFHRTWELMTAQENAIDEVSKEMELKKLGDNADDRIRNVEGFLRNNLEPEAYEKAQEFVTTAESIELIEMLVKATMPSRLPIDGGEHPEGLTWQDVEAEMFKRHENGQFLRSVDPNHERKVQQMLASFGG